MTDAVPAAAITAAAQAIESAAGEWHGWIDAAGLARAALEAAAPHITAQAIAEYKAAHGE